MLLTDSAAIRDVLLFPTMKPLDSDKKVEKAAEKAEEKNAETKAEAPAEAKTEGVGETKEAEAKDGQ